MRTMKTTLGICGALATTSLAAGCYKLSGDCELNLCAPVQTTAYSGS